MHPVEVLELILILFGTAIALRWLASRAALPPSATLMIGGGALAYLPGIPAVGLDPELALVLFLPPLLMDGAYFTAFGRFRRHLPGILSLAIGAVLFTTLVVGMTVHWLVPQLPWAACFALGAIVSPPDAVAARAVLHGVTLPRRLQALIEGESLLNDATGLVLFRFAVAATLTGAFDAGHAVGSFAILAAGGVLVGFLVGALWMGLLRRLTDQTLNVAAATLLCWAAYLAGEALHVSGVIATVTAGIMFGWSQHVIQPARTRLEGGAFWRTLIFGLEAMIFILIGFSLRGTLERVGGTQAVLTTFALPVLGVIVAMLVARIVWVFGIDGLVALLRRLGFSWAKPLGWRRASVLSWAGMRGVVTLAVALTLPEAMPGRDLMLVAAFAAILATVIVQGSTLGLLIRLVRPTDDDPPPAMDLPASEAAVAGAKFAAAEAVAYAPDGTLLHPQLLQTYRDRAAATARFAEDADKFMSNVRPHFDLVLEVIAAGRAELIRQHRAGLIEDEVLHDLERDLDLEEMSIIYQRGE